MDRITDGFIDDEQVGFRSGRRCINQIFTLKQIGEKAQGVKTKNKHPDIIIHKVLERDIRGPFQFLTDNE